MQLPKIGLTEAFSTALYVATTARAERDDGADRQMMTARARRSRDERDATVRRVHGEPSSS